MKIPCSIALVAGALGAAAAWAAEAPLPAIIPQPAHLERQAGTFELTARTAISFAGGAAEAQILAADLRKATGFELPVTTTEAQPAGRRITLLLQTNQLEKFGAEGYALTATPQQIVITAATGAGLFYGERTLLQLLPPEIFAPHVVKHCPWQIPCVEIADRPRFGWRGLMLDSGHDFQRKEFVKHYIDLMALYKFNLFHWHLTDLGTWSVEIKGYPELLKSGTRGPGVKPGYYTQDEIRDVVRYAAARHITILPEVDMPGHSAPALLAYPGLDCPLPHHETGWPYNTVANGAPRPWEYCLGNEKTYAFLEDVLGQIVDLFPGPYIHIGGDECPKGRWLRCPLCQARMKAEQLADGEALQSYFIKRIEKFLQAKGRRMIGWDEILEGGLAPQATVMSWRGMSGGIAAAQAGHDVIMAPFAWTYFDYKNSPKVEEVYSFDPLPRELSAAQGAHVLGAQGQMWTDLHQKEKGIEALVYPRAVALAEVVWSPLALRNFEDFVRRLQTDQQRLDQLGVNYRPYVPETQIQIGDLTPAQIKATPAPFEWDVTPYVTESGKNHVSFVCTSDAGGIEVAWVALLKDGKEACRDTHTGWAGTNPRLPVFYILNEPAWKSGAHYTLRAQIAGGTNSAGRVFWDLRSPPVNK